MDQNKITSKEYFKGIKIIHLALAIGQAFFLLVAFGLVQTGNYEIAFQDSSNIFNYLVVIFGLLGISSSFLIFKNRLNSCKEKTNLIDKMECYRSSLLIRYALLQAPSFFAIVFYLLTGTILYLAIPVIIIVIFILIRPTHQKAEIDLELNSTEVQMINNPDALISIIEKH
ncbi:MAG: hypothetical protein WCP69_01480 [Bacteroidota bacterium]